MAFGMYARGPIVLPHPSYPKATLRLIERAIAEAWRIMRDSPEDGFDIASATEDRITLELRKCLMNQILDGPAIPGFTSAQFSISREAKFESYDGAFPDKMPDLHISVVRDTPPSLPAEDGIFIECKPVGAAHPTGSTYCDKGIIRFVAGEYAWAMSEGFMIGYAAADYPIATELPYAVKKRKVALKCAGDASACTETTSEGYTQQPYITVHGRGFAYRSTNTLAPTITIRHIWLRRN